MGDGSRLCGGGGGWSGTGSWARAGGRDGGDHHAVGHAVKTKSEQWGRRDHRGEGQDARQI
eukprot:2650933-Prymnesium_polylepis.1